MVVVDFLKNLTDPQYIIQYGGLALLIFVVFAECSFLVGFFLPGNSLIFVSGIVCNLKPEIFGVNLLVLILAMSFGAMFGNLIGYVFGKKKFGPFLFKNEKSKIFKPHYKILTSRFYEKKGGKILIIGRFLPLIRTFAPIIAGIIEYDFKKFMLYNITGALVWIGALAGIGYYLGHLKWVQNHIDLIVIILVIIALIPIVILYQVEKSREKKIATK